MGNWVKCLLQLCVSIYRHSALWRKRDRFIADYAAVTAVAVVAEKMVKEWRCCCCSLTSGTHQLEGSVQRRCGGSSGSSSSGVLPPYCVRQMQWKRRGSLPMTLTGLKLNLGCLELNWRQPCSLNFWKCFLLSAWCLSFINWRRPHLSLAWPFQSDSGQFGFIYLIAIETQRHSLVLVVWSAQKCSLL